MVGPLLCLAGVVLVVVPPFVPAVAGALPDIGITPGANEVTNWANWNYSGYEGKASYPEYQAINATMASVGRRYGCGRALWEYNSDENRFGTPEALMLLPYWTGGCIDSEEGLLFESSATTPYHFINQAELSVSPSEAVVGLPYGALDVPLGIEHLQLLGVRYFTAFSPQIQQAAAADPTLRKVASTGPWSADYDGQELSTTWDVYLVAHSAAVTPLVDEPAVLAGVGPGQSSWLGQIGPQGQPVSGPAISWYDDPSRWDVELTAGGLPSWPRVTAHTAARAPRVPVPATTVTRIRQTADSISFHVSRVGHAGAGEDLVLPQLEGVRGRGPLAGHAQPDGGGSHQPRGDPHLRHHRGQRPRRRVHGRRPGRRGRHGRAVVEAPPDGPRHRRRSVRRSPAARWRTRRPVPHTLLTASSRFPHPPGASSGQGPRRRRGGRRSRRGGPMRRRTPVVAVVALAAAGLVLGACGGGSTHVVGPGAGTTTTSHLRPATTTTSSATAPGSLAATTTTSAPHPSSAAPAASTSVTAALTAQITSELSQLDQSLAQANGDLSSNGTGPTTGGK